VNGEKRVDQAFIRRRKKEYQSVIVISFLKVYKCFKSLYRDFYKYEEDYSDFTDSGFSERINKLCEMSILDLKERTDFLFRNSVDIDKCNSETLEKYIDLKKMLTSGKNDQIKKKKMKDLFLELRRTLLNQSIDSNINKIYRKLMVLKENLYELEFYRIRSIQEHQLIDKTGSLLKLFNQVLNEKEEDEMQHIIKLDRLSRKIISDTISHTKMVLDICTSLFKETSVVLLYIIQDSGRNEVLILNLLENIELIETIYGKGASERIFSRMFTGIDSTGNSGTEKALNFLKNNCDNISGLPDSC